MSIFLNITVRIRLLISRSIIAKSSKFKPASFKGCETIQNVPITGDGHYNGCHKYVPIDLFLFIYLVSRRMIEFRPGSCLSKLERVKGNIINRSRCGG